jgi:hypothetical protein
VGALHLVRGPGEGVGLELARRQAERDEVIVVLIQDGVRLPAPAGLRTLALAEGAQDPPAVEGPDPVDPRELVRLLETHERVYVW